MITNLNLESFGKFRNKSFDLGKTTIFVGKNESGKTTLLDAFSWAMGLNDLPGTETGKKSIVNRYGKATDLKVNIESVGLNFSDDELKNFLGSGTFSEGELASFDSSKFSNSTSWQNYLKETLLDQSINLKNVIKTFDSILKPRANNDWDKKVKKNKLDINQTETELQEAQKEYKVSLELIGKKTQNQEMVDVQNVRLKEIEAQLEKGKNQLAVLQNQKKKIDLRKRLALETDWKTKEAILDEMNFYAKDLAFEFEDLQQKEFKANSLVENKKNELRELEDKTKLLQAGISDSSTSDLGAKKGSFAEKHLSAWDEAYQKNRFHQEKRETKASPLFRKLSYLFATLSLTALCYLGFAFSQGIANPNLFLASVSLAISIVLFFLFFFKKETILISEFSEEEEKLFLASIQREFILQFQSKDIQLFQTSSDLKAFLQKLVLEKSNSALIKKEKEKELELSEANFKEKRLFLEKIEQDSRKANLELNHWLESKKVANFEEYKTKRSKYENTKSQIEQILASLGFANAPDKAKAYFIGLKEEIQSLPEATETEQDLDLQFAKLDAEIPALAQEREALLSQINLAKTGIANAEGKLESRSKLETKIHNLIAKLSDLRKEESEINKLQISNRISKEIFEEINNDSSHQFTQLANQLKEEWRFLLGEKEIKLSEFAIKSIELEDSGGTERNLENLSHGTKGLFYFIFKLLLHLKHPSPFKCLFLDDALHFFDADRLEKILMYLKNKQEKVDLQIFFFTKPNMSFQLMQKIYPKAVIHELG